MTTEEKSVIVSDNPTESRYEVKVDGELAGYAEYKLADTVISFTHTKVFDEYGGQGLAQKLAASSLDAARERGLSVLPLCPFYAKFIGKNTEYVDLVPQDRRAEFKLA